jgi:hypothetical protein
MGRRDAMRRSALSILAALVLVPLLGGGVALAAPPAPPQVTGVSVMWDMRTWDDGISRCTIMADAMLDPAFTKGQPIYALAYYHYKWVGVGGEDTFYWFSFNSPKVSRGATKVHVYGALETWDQGHYVVDAVRFDLISLRGKLISSMEVSTTNTCANGPTG